MILAIETATEVCSTAVVHQQTVLSVRSVQEKNIHSERLMTLINEVLTESKCSKEQLDAVAVSIGPGSFTGLRIGLSTAKGLALALNIPLIAVPTLDGIAEAYRMEQGSSANGMFCAMIDAKRDEAYYSIYSLEHGSAVRQKDFSITFKTGIAAEAEQTGAVITQPSITAAAVGLLSEMKKKEFLVKEFATLEPLYLRDFVATLPKPKI
ncbi:MAG: tRNA (adenosine(37)-N6)-threonylcarbamoyltransferase complex dimerization subunit type 1 TsaB [Bacteroidota bacterium]|jgi:tRNA threonylcarbamoyladenosine biosynthesis protein TsaB